MGMFLCAGRSYAISIRIPSLLGLGLCLPARARLIVYLPFGAGICLKNAFVKMGAHPDHIGCVVYLPFGVGAICIFMYISAGRYTLPSVLLGLKLGCYKRVVVRARADRVPIEKSCFPSWFLGWQLYMHVRNYA